MKKYTINFKRSVFLIALFALVVSPFFSLPTAQAQTTTTKYLNGKVVFDTDRDGNAEIYTMNSDGSSQTRLTNNSTGDLNANWSPDGSKIVFSSNRDGNYEIYTMNADGTNQTRITNSPTSDDRPNWSPDGTKLTFNSNRDGNYEIYTMNADGTNQTRITNNAGSDTYPSWAPDGTRIVFVSNRDGNQEIYTMNANGSNVMRITNNAGNDYDPAWSPDGAKLAFSSDRNSPGGGPYNEDLYTMNADGTNVTRITNTVEEEETVSWSPDGAKLFVTAYPDENYTTYDVYLYNADGTSPLQLTSGTGDNESYSSQAWQRLPYTVVTNDDGSVVSTIPASASYSATDYTVAANETLVLDGQLCDVIVQSGGTLMGTGHACTITVQPGGKIAPGHSPGCLSSGNLSLSGTYSAELIGTTACSGYDQLQVTGTITVGGALNVSLLNGFIPTAGSVFTLITNDATDPGIGSFAGLAEGSTITIGTSRFTISYVGGTGNDVTLTALAPLPGLPMTGSAPVASPRHTVSALPLMLNL